VITLFQLQFARECDRLAASPAQRAGCNQLGKTLATSWFGRGGAK
jgi:hypothetical protein